jgi:hypothetical protein
MAGAATEPLVGVASPQLPWHPTGAQGDRRPAEDVGSVLYVQPWRRNPEMSGWTRRLSCGTRT